MGRNGICAARCAVEHAEAASIALWCRLAPSLTAAKKRVRAAFSDERGQGTTEYAILVGVLVVMAIIAIALFRPRLQELWNSIAEGINSL